MSDESEVKTVLPVVAVKEAFSYVLQDRDFSKRIVILCSAMLTFIYVLADFLMLPETVINLSGIVVDSFFVYCWHRFVLLDKADIRGDSWMPFLRRTFLYYAGLAILLIGGVALFSLVLGGANDLFIGIFPIVPIIILMFFLPRIALVFPALAVESSENKLRDALALSNGHTLRMVGAYLMMFVCIVLVMLPFTLITGLSETNTLGGAPGLLFIIITNVFAGLTAAITAVLIAGLNSSIYRQLGGNIPAETEGRH